MVYNVIIYNQGGTDLRTTINRTRRTNKLERRKIGCTMSTCWKRGSSSSGVWGWQRGRGGSKPSVVFADVSAWPLLGVISQLPVQITTLVWYRAGKCFMIACHGHRGRSGSYGLEEGIPEALWESYQQHFISANKCKPVCRHAPMATPLAGLAKCFLWACFSLSCSCLPPSSALRAA